MKFISRMQGLFSRDGAQRLMKDKYWELLEIKGGKNVKGQ
jgi:hypothetical protein